MPKKRHGYKLLLVSILLLAPTLINNMDITPTITDSVKTIPYHDIPVNMETKKPLTQHEFALLTVDQPNVLLDNCKAIYVCDESGQNTCTQAYGRDMSDCSGFSQDQNIYINRKDRKDFHDTVTYELSRQYDLVTKVSSLETWQTLYNTYNNDIHNDASGFFAKQCEIYFNHIDQMDNQDIYNALQSTFHYYNQDLDIEKNKDGILKKQVENLLDFLTLPIYF